MESNEKQNCLSHEMIEMNSVPTHVIKLGSKESLTNNKSAANDSVIILMISGNPGEIGYYSDFLSIINKSTNISVIGLSHAGHNIPTIGLNIPLISENPDLYSLEGQIYHKMAFIEKYISTNSKLILIGHSIGCYIILEILNRSTSIASKVLHSILIFPTIESIGQTSEGRKYTFLFNWLKYPLLGLSYILNFLSDHWKEKIVFFATQPNNNLQRGDPPKCVLKAATNLFNPNCLMALIHMSLLEFKTVNHLNTEAIDQNKNRLTFLYGEADKWCPIEFYERIANLYPDIDIRLCLKDMDHAFVMQTDSTNKIAELVIEKINSVLNTSNR